jgi:hypothetical protein
MIHEDNDYEDTEFWYLESKQRIISLIEIKVSKSSIDIKKKFSSNLFIGLESVFLE